MGLKVAYTEEALDDLAYWKKIGNKSVQKKITSLIQAIQETPFDGIGKPEPLKHKLSGKWSRRIDKEDRIVYEILVDMILIHSLKGHYD